MQPYFAPPRKKFSLRVRFVLIAAALISACFWVAAYAYLSIERAQLVRAADRMTAFRLCVEDERCTYTVADLMQFKADAEMVLGAEK